jgi:hypothetical protein
VADSLPLFDSSPVATVPPLVPVAAPRFPRERQIERAEGKVPEEFYERYLRVLRVVGQVQPDFTANEVTLRFEERYGKLTVEEMKGIGGRYQRWQRERIFEKTGTYRPRDNGNMCAAYRLVRTNANS